MKEPSFPCCWNLPIAFISDCTFRLVNAYDSDADRVPATAPELDHLVSKIVDYAVDLFNHRLGENLHLDANLYGCYRSSSYQVAWVQDRAFTRNDFTKRSVAAPSLNASAPILNVHHQIFPI